MLKRKLKGVKNIRGVVIKKAKVIAEDDRRKIISLLNGEIGVRDIHILEMKKGEQILGNHYHWYEEIMLVYKGKAHYWLRNKITKEQEEVDLEAGDIMLKSPMIAHTCMASEDCILIDGSAVTWVSEDFNHIREVLK